MQVYNVCLRLEDQMGTQCTYNGPIVWGYNACTKDQSMGMQCMHKEPILLGTMCKCTVDGTVHVATHSYVYVQSLKSSISSTKSQL